MPQVALRHLEISAPVLHELQVVVRHLSQAVLADLEQRRAGGAGSSGECVATSS